jgi:hypothetical protein
MNQTKEQIREGLITLDFFDGIVLKKNNQIMESGTENVINRIIKINDIREKTI